MAQIKVAPGGYGYPTPIKTQLNIDNIHYNGIWTTDTNTMGTFPSSTNQGILQTFSGTNDLQFQIFHDGKVFYKRTKSENSEWSEWSLAPMGLAQEVAEDESDNEEYFAASLSLARKLQKQIDDIEISGGGTDFSKFEITDDGRLVINS